ncbi:hypothetical protein CIHG_02943 [Coccidioides immitis H538.4]|uniref:non-specific serine/threonine protein kinase n=1 Tax=Coccidioides immitis H538.4 TaxID=396776 RepID=A0A0J8RKJ8_COCIT|nr:hypothetical protein CIHG_02943 [Coccidioides immitis H538.4]
MARAESHPENIDHPTPDHMQSSNHVPAVSSQRQKQPESELTFTVESVHTSSLFNKDDKVYDNCILHCLVISPAGWPIYKYESPLELLMALQDAIKAHQSLYLDGNILHRDISENNIIITDSTNIGSTLGVLINLNLTKECAHCGWMNLKKLQLESHEGQKLPKDSMLKEWYTGTYKKIVRIKRSDMGVDRFDDILSEFPLWFECIKPLCNAVWDTLFPYRKTGLIVGTPQDPKRLYDPIIKVYEDTIALLEAGKI